jgi:hypothetical protein
MYPLTLATKEIILFAMILLILASYIRRSEAIGGWLLLFFSQVYFGVVFTLLFSIPVVARAFPSVPPVASPTRRFVVILVLVRLAAYAILAIASTFLLRERNSIWLQRLRLALGLALLLSATTLVLDYLYFPGSLVRGLVGWLVLLVWLIYFFVSDRVKMVFVNKTWG